MIADNNLDVYNDAKTAHGNGIFAMKPVTAPGEVSPIATLGFIMLGELVHRVSASRWTISLMSTSSALGMSNPVIAQASP